MRENFNKILSNYLDAKNTAFGGNEIAHFIRSSFPEEIKQIIGDAQYKIIGSPGKGNWATVPWIGIFDKDVTDTAQKGYYLVYLFRADMEGFYLSFSQGVTEFSKYGYESSKRIKESADKYREILNRYESNTNYLEDIDLNSAKTLTKNYEKATIRAIYYDKNELPSEEVLINDLKKFLNYYKFVKENESEIKKPFKEPEPYKPRKEPPTIQTPLFKGEDSFYEYLHKKGYLFDKETIENYLLSLKVKPFAILTGNSGTGKTKLSQLFANYIAKKSETKIENSTQISTDVIVGKSYSAGGWSLKKEDCEKILPIYEYDNVYPITVDGIATEGRLTNTLRLFYRGDEVREHLSNLSNIDPKKRIPLKIEISEEKPNIISKYYKIIPVGANWTENRNIVGYYNPITEEYQSTPAYELIKQANNDKNNPYFLILDEMNLSHVERYFADFLSAIESGENIPLYGTDEELEIPENLFIIGTVNVDETTYMFSPKVLDRANTLEFETYSAYDYMTGEFNLQSPQGDLDYLQNPLSDLNIKNLGIKELKEEFKNVTVNGEDFWEIFSDEIYNFQITLKESGFDFGFRVINEIARFMYVAWKYEGKPTTWTNWNRYLDAQIKQKMLPKLHGSEKIIGETLGNLYAACEYNYPTSAKKILEMIDVLEKQRYVSFIN